MPDKALAQRLGCSKSTVLRARRRFGISPFDPSRSSKGIDWEAVALGARPDTEIADELGVAVPVVYNARRRRGIEPHTPRQASVNWHEVPLGDVPDEALAKELGVSQPTVTRHRNRLGVLPCKTTFVTTEGEAADSYPEALIDLFWHEQGIDHEFQVSVGPYVADWRLDGGVLVEYAGFIESRKFGSWYKDRLEAKVAYYKSQGLKVRVLYPSDLPRHEPQGAPQTTKDLISQGINWSMQPLGEMSDASLAKRLGVPPGTVSRWRRKLGIGKYTKPARDWSGVPLGEEPDPVLALRLGVSKETVRRARVSLGVPSYRSGHAT
jgi:DNA-binding CsgD family transcriptional regulator